MIRHLPHRLRWRAKQHLAGDSRYYGDGGTVHSTGHLDVELHDGAVVAVWFRCQPLPFRQHTVDRRRAVSMAGMSRGLRTTLTGVEVKDG